MNKHAYLIICHKNPKQISLLLKMLDNSRNDIYILIDKKASFDKDDLIGLDKAKVTFIKKTNLKWGTYSQVKAKLSLLDEATREYHDYYHLISGQCLPIKPQKQIFDFFDKNQGKEFIHYIFIPRAIEVRYKQFYLFRTSPAKNKPLKQKIVDFIDRKFVSIQRAINIDRTRDYKIYTGSAFFSITHQMASYILANQKNIKKHFNYTVCPDEAFVQTIAANSPFANNIVRDNLYLIDWKRSTNLGNSPYIFTSSDYSVLTKSSKLYARKFDESIDQKIISEIVHLYS